MPALAASFAYDQSGAALRQQPRQSLNGYREGRPHIAVDNGDRNEEVSQTIYSKTFGERARDALRRRLHPHTGIRAHDLAVALQISEATVWNVLSGNSKSGPSGRVFDKLVEFFGAGFLQEIFGGPNVHCFDPRDARKADALRKMIEAQEELRRLG
jgi:transcriptional regulator with XRE-family HTH domain